MVCGKKLIKSIVFFICLATVPVLSEEASITKASLLSEEPPAAMTFDDFFYSTQMPVNNKKDLEAVIEKTDRAMAFQNPIIDLFGVRAYFPKEKMGKIKDLLMTFEKTDSKKPSISKEEDEAFSNQFVCKIILFNKVGHFLTKFGYYYPNQLITEDRTIWTSPRYKELESIFKEMFILVPPVVGGRR